MSKVIVPGTIVCANFVEFDGKTSVGLFYVLYDEASDSNNFHKDNIVGLKITSTSPAISNYMVDLKHHGSNSFIEKQCYVMCSKIHTLDKSQIYKVLGEVGYSTYKAVYKTYNKFLFELNRQVDDYL